LGSSPSFNGAPAFQPEKHRGMSRLR
jgi:hypothetical protein